MRVMLLGNASHTQCEVELCVQGSTLNLVTITYAFQNSNSKLG